MRKKRNQPIGGRVGLIALTGVCCLAFSAWQTGRVQAQTQGPEIVLSPSAPTQDNGIEGVYGYYNADNAISVDVVVNTGEDNPGIREISYWITDGTEEAGEEMQERILYEDFYEEEPEEEPEEEEPEEEEPEQEEPEEEDPEEEDPEGEMPDDEKDSEETEEPEEPGKYQPLQCWSGCVLVHPERWHTGEVRVHVKLIDFAGEEWEDSVQLDIDIDAPELLLTGVEDGGSYRGAVMPEVEIRDHHLSAYEVTITRTRLDKVGEDVTDLFFADQELSAEGGRICGISPERTRENDGIYMLHVTATDGAGNKSELTAAFSVNRFGSVYEFDEYLLSLLRNGGAYVREITKDLVITEYNADPLVEDALCIDITRDGRPVKEVHYREIQSGTGTEGVGERGWYEYRYVISKDNFTQDGIYKVSVSSKDKAGNTPDNVGATGREILFRLDSTAPEITGMIKTDADGNLALEENFFYTVYDTMGLRSLEIGIDGEEPETITDFGSNVNYYEGTLSLEPGIEECKIRLAATDFAGNVTEESYTLPAETHGILRRQNTPYAPTRLEQIAQSNRRIACILGISCGGALLAVCFLVRKIRKKKNKKLYQI